ncbi:NH(3)-dependent NAD(+) synthetase [Desulfonispora thiosulfatigenes DSM 11270]|uniref:Glutamine-dependent NAD(+) synthetase n=2 Tax=Desulfonispora thiosulfatigenes TaxID=83661 RepID=A0A1W1V3X7_DESTI|nr:NH(3)-dependent NAD(+) synthetase [Desulfonispora thiosulfatigenes DSM 11270]
MEGDDCMNNYGFLKVAAATPKIKVADTIYNTQEILRLMDEASEQECALLVFPELSLTGYTCGDLFQQRHLLDSAVEQLDFILQSSRDNQVLTLIGMPLSIKQRLYNCAVAILKGRILGIVPKMHIPNSKEYYEKRWFNSGFDYAKESTVIELLGQKVSFGSLLFECTDLPFSLGVEICEDLWSPIPPSSYLSLKGASIIANLSASNEYVGKSDYRKLLISQQSSRCICGYIYASAGVHESTTDLVFGGDSAIYENGTSLKESQLFNRESELIISEIDIERLISERQKNTSFSENTTFLTQELNTEIINFSYVKDFRLSTLSREINPLPFVPGEEKTLDSHCQEIFSITTAALAKRLEHTKIDKVVVGISGGLDSTLALLSIVQTFDLLNIERKNILAITMPGFGTSDLTYNYARDLMEKLGVTSKEINITEACLTHFKDIEHDKKILDTTYENVQARERTQILMDYANKNNALVMGTGDLSELALGWATYNGDHMSMYSLNSGIPKTLVQFLLKWAADNNMYGLKETLYGILDMPISPELIPTDKEGAIKQKTEDLVGPYELHDFYLYYFLRYGMSPKKILFLAETAFKDKYPKETILKWLKVFYHRFFSQQFKRSCIPDGPKVGSVSLSPRGDWRMPSDASSSIWLKELEE